jgi:hypothetical protein
MNIRATAARLFTVPMASAIIIFIMHTVLKFDDRTQTNIAGFLSIVLIIAALYFRHVILNSTSIHGLYKVFAFPYIILLTALGRLLGEIFDTSIWMSFAALIVVSAISIVCSLFVNRLISKTKEYER